VHDLGDLQPPTERDLHTTQDVHLVAEALESLGALLSRVGTAAQEPHPASSSGIVRG
jgi:hypothetical protein